MPTDNEINENLRTRPFLPKIGDAQEYCANDVDKLLDRNFRLLRHELLFPLAGIISALRMHFSPDAVVSDAQQSAQTQFLSQIRRHP
jgi:hypothetical protein